MKILMFVKNFLPITQTFIYQEVTGLAKSNQVKILTTHRENEARFPFGDVAIASFSKNTLEHKIRKTLQGWDWEIGFRNFAFSKKIKKCIQDFNPDVIHTQFGWESWILLLNFPIQEKPIFLHFHGFDASHKLLSAKYLKTLKKILNRPDITPIFISKTMLKAVETKVGKIEKYQILHCGIDIGLFKKVKRNLAKNPFIFLQVSSFAEKKGHIYTIKAYAEFIKNNPNHNSILKLAGDGLLLNDMKLLVKSLNIEQNVEFLGSVTSSEAKELMDNVHCFLHHSVTSSIGDQEGIPTAIMEAMAMELPIISTFHSGIPELVEDGVNGYLVAEKNISQYANRMQDILSWDYILANRTVIDERFEKEKHIDYLVSFYQNELKKD